MTTTNTLPTAPVLSAEQQAAVTSAKKYIKGNAHKTFAQQWKMGEQLNTLKDLVGNGKYLHWLKTNLPGVSYATLNRMRNFYLAHQDGLPADYTTAKKEKKKTKTTKGEGDNELTQIGKDRKKVAAKVWKLLTEVAAETEDPRIREAIDLLVNGFALDLDALRDEMDRVTSLPAEDREETE